MDFSSEHDSSQSVVTNREDLKKYIVLLYKRIATGEKIQQAPKVILSDNIENVNQDPLGKTAYYDPANKLVRVYITGRLIVDILRSFSHECIHHVQNERGDFNTNDDNTGTGYAQTNPHLRKMEEEAYLKGSLYLRDFQDELRKHMGM